MAGVTSTVSPGSHPQNGEGQQPVGVHLPEPGAHLGKDSKGQREGTQTVAGPYHILPCPPQAKPFSYLMQRSQSDEKVL